MRLKELRESSGLSQKVFAEKLGIAQNSLSQYETGKREPDTAMLVKISDFFHVSLDYLLECTDDPSTSKDSHPTKMQKPDIPEDVRDLAIAFHKGGLTDLTQDEIDNIVEIARILKAKNKKRQ